MVALGHRVLQLVPVAVDVVEVRATVGRAALGVDGSVKVRAALRLVVESSRGPAVGLLPRKPLGSGSVANQAVFAGQRGDVAGAPRVDPRLAREDVLGMGGQARAQLEACGRR